MAEIEKVCIDCGASYVGGYKARFCPKCKKLRCSRGGTTKGMPYHGFERDLARQREQMRAKKTPAFKPAKCPEDCVYLQTVANIPMCGFFLITDELRGCDPGAKCKRYIGKNADLKNARHRKATWDVVKGKELWKQGRSDGEIGKELHVNRRAVNAYRRRVWEKAEC